MSAPRVLVVDDEPTVRDVVGKYLTRDGFQVAELDNGAAVAETVASFRPDLVVLDVMLPGASGLDVLRGLDGRLPVILLTARTDEQDKVLGLELGADDYVVKPFSPRELVARVRSVLRRAAAPAATSEQRLLQFGELRIDVTARECWVEDQPIVLTAKEFDLLVFLADHPKVAFSRGQLLEHVWDSSADYQDPATVTVHVRRIRNKIDHDPEDPRWIRTIWGVGYRFEP
jgi:DNA-binding response OmpR family regulator